MLVRVRKEFQNSKKDWNFPTLHLIRLDQALSSKPKVPVARTSNVYFKKVVVKWSIGVFLNTVMLKHGRFRPKIEWNFTFHLLMRGVTASWASIHYGTSTLARPCLMVGSAGCTRLGYGGERQEYFRSQLIIFHFRNNSADSLSICAPCALSPRHLTHKLSRPGHHPCML